MFELGSIEAMRLTPLTVPIARSTDAASIPAQARKWDAGYDLTAVESGYIRAGQRRLIGTGIHVAIPDGYVGFIKPRSGLAFRHGIDILGGVIDSGFRGEVKVILINHGDMEYRWGTGDRIAQLVIQPVMSVDFTEVPLVSDLAVSERASAGFGSTGVN